MMADNECLVGVELALAVAEVMRAAGVNTHGLGSKGFRCRRCGRPVIPRRTSGNPYFVHVPANPQCGDD